MKYINLLILSITLFSCNNNIQNKEVKVSNSKKDSLSLVIENLDGELKNKNILSKESYIKANELIKSYKLFINTYLNDSLSENYLFNLIMYEQGAKLTNDALKDMDKFIQTYPSNEKAPEILNMQAAIYDIDFHDVNLAKKKYLLLIKNYPNHPLAIKAKEILDSGDLELTIEERVKKWQSKT